MNWGAEHDLEWPRATKSQRSKCKFKPAEGPLKQGSRSVFDDKQYVTHRRCCVLADVHATKDVFEGVEGSIMIEVRTRSIGYFS